MTAEAHRALIPRIVAAASRAGGYLGGIGVMVLMLHVVADVALRFTVNRTMPGTLEISQYWYLPAAIFLGMAAAYSNDDHISAPIIYERVSSVLKREFHLIAAMLSIVFLLAMAWWGFEEAMTQMRQGAIGIGSGVSIWPPRFLVPLCSLLFASEIAVRLVRDLRAPRPGSGAQPEEHKDELIGANTP
ncbi:TRAP transporter small permease [Nesterenkonia muleiensis]|uniref:TRAP transporter small permease n=1 Tax=Nesterenkonia muleiensis TaxID=2282648 RepID=UPI0013004D75|nr:TRAP transporter small permease [Nesterenkonia muleiensis]